MLFSGCIQIISQAVSFFNPPKGWGGVEKNSLLRHMASFLQATPGREGGYHKIFLHVYPKFP